MPTPHPLLGAPRLATDATTAITDLVEAMHAEITRLPLTAARTRTTGITGLVYRSVRGVTRLVGGGLDLALGALTPLLGQVESAKADAVRAALNGVLGDHLDATANPLATPMSLHPLAGDAGRPALVLLHGLCMNEAQWRRDGVDLPTALAAQGYQVRGLRYNSGRPIWRNGAELATLLEALPGPITLLGHSMGGLVARSAIAQARSQGMTWPGRLQRLITLGTPHLGAPLERGGQQVQLLLGVSAYARPLATLAARRSAGIRDLRFGTLLEADTGRGSRIALPEGVACFAVAATLSKQAAGQPARWLADLGNRPARWLGDGLVPVASALGQHRDPARRLAFTGTVLFPGLGHLGLQTDEAVLAQLKAWLSRA